MYLGSLKLAVPLAGAVLLALPFPALAQPDAQEDAQTEEQSAPFFFEERAALAFEEGRWEDAIREFREILAAYPEDRISWLRIAQAERELGRHEQALATLEQARTANAPEAMVDLERARNLLALRRNEEGLTALEMADHIGLRALALLDAKDFDAVRGEARFADVRRHVRGRVFPCEAMPEAADFDFWLGEWEVRTSGGAIAGHNTITKRNGGCLIHEEWQRRVSRQNSNRGPVDTKAFRLVSAYVRIATLEGRV
jgi:tetratricopeptide (TPR) repeat protein